MKRLFITLVLALVAGMWCNSVFAQIDVTSVAYGAAGEGWLRDNDGGNWGTSPYGSSGDAVKGWEQWQGAPGALNNRIMYKVAPLAPGTYTVTAKVNAQQQGTYKSDEVYFYAADQQVKCYGAQTERTLTFTIDQTQAVQIGVKVSETEVVNWVSVEDLKVETSSYASAEDFTAALGFDAVGVFDNNWQRDNSGGNFGGYGSGWEQWQAAPGSLQGRIMYKSATLPAGTYTLVARTHAEMQGENNTNREAYLYFGNQQETCYGGFANRAITITLAEPQKVEFGITAPAGNVNWVTIENVKILTSSYASAAEISAAVDDYLQTQAGIKALNDGEIPTNSTDNWRVSTLGAGETFVVNTWSTEGKTDGSNMLTPFLQNWHGKGTNLVDKTITYPMKGMDEGWYEVSGLFRCLNEAGNATPAGIYMTMNGDEYDMTEGATACTNGCFKKLTKAVKVESDGMLVIGVKVKEATVNWINWRDFTITKMPPITQEDIDTEWALMPEKCDAALSAAAVAAKSAVEASLSPADFAALKEAVSACVSNAEIFAKAGENLVKLEAEFANTNVYTPEAIAAFNATKAAYNDGTLTTEAALAISVGGGHRQANSYDDVLLSAWTIGGEQCSEYTKNLYINTWSTEANGKANGSGMTAPFFEYWVSDGNSLSATALAAKVAVPNGYYKVSALVRVRIKNNGGDAANGISLQAGDGIIVDVCDGATCDDGAPFRYGTYEAWAQVTDGNLDIKIDVKEGNNVSWLSYKNVKYAEVTEEEYAAYYEANRNPSTEEIAALNAAIISAEGGANLGFLAGQNAPYNNVEQLKTIASAKAIDTASAKATAVNAATAALGSLVWTSNVTEVNAVYDGDFANKELSTDDVAVTAAMTAGGWSETGSYRQLFDQTTHEKLTGRAIYVWGSNDYKYGEKIGYTMPLEANTVYKLSIKHGSWSGGNNNFKVSVLNGEDGLASTDLGASNEGFDNVGLTESVRFFTTGAAGNYILSVNPGGNSVFSDISIVKAPAATATMAIGSAKYATFIAPFDVEVPAGVTASKVTGIEEDNTTLVLEDIVGAIPANTPVVLYSENAVNQTFNGQSIAVKNEYTEGWLTGVYAATEAPEGSYVLQNHDGVVGFYEVAETKPTVGANRAYLTVPAEAAAVKAFYFDKATGINAVEGVENSDAIYDLSGRRVSNAVKGIYIINGKKVLK